MKGMFFTLCSLAIASTSAYGSGATGTTTIGSIHYLNTGIVNVWVDITPSTRAPITNIPACVNPQAVGNQYSYAFDATTPAGRILLAGLISAQTSGLSIWPAGTGDCGVLAGHETLLNFFVETQ